MDPIGALLQAIVITPVDVSAGLNTGTLSGDIGGTDPVVGGHGRIGGPFPVLSGARAADFSDLAKYALRFFPSSRKARNMVIN